MNIVLRLLCAFYVLCSPAFAQPTMQGGNTAPVKGQFDLFHYTASDGVSRPYVVYTPDSIAIGEQRPLLVHLHGAISRPTLQTEPIAYLSRSRLLALADQGRYYVLFPFGQKGATWFDSVGVGMVMGQVDEVLAKFAVDPNRVFMSGFSDGGSGTFYLAANYPSRFAGFIAFNGAFPVATTLGERRSYPQNLAHRPLMVINTDKDMLYPAASMQAMIHYLRQYQPKLQALSPKGAHDLRYLPTVMTDIIDFIDRHQRPVLSTIDWEGSSDSGLDWLHIETLASDEHPQDWHRPYQFKLHNDKASWGVQFAPAEGGLRIAMFGKNSVAKRMGAQLGDVVTAMENIPMDNAYAPYVYLADKKAGDATQLTIRRGEDTIVLNGHFNPGYDYEVFDKIAPSARVKASIQGDTLQLSTSQVQRLRVHVQQLPKQVRWVRLNEGELQPIGATSWQVFTP